MKFASVLTTALVILIAIPRSDEGKSKNTRFCDGEDGNRYKKGEGYEDKEACIRYSCTRKRHKLKMKKEKISCSDDDLPDIDLNNPDAASDLLKALQNFGFSYIRDNSIPQPVIDNASKLSKEFFKLPFEDKFRVIANKKRSLKTARGYTGLRDEQLDVSDEGLPDIKEVFDIGYIRNTNGSHYLGVNKWPANLPNLQDAIETYAEHNSLIAQRVLSLLSKGLGVEGVFDSLFGENALQVQRLSRYPSKNEVEDIVPGELGAGTHSDFGGITVLLAEGSGLFVLRPNNTSPTVDRGTFSPELTVPHSGQWISVKSKPGTFIVMGGESLQRISNGNIYAAKHKVDNTGENARHSLAFFYDPRPDALLEPLDELVQGIKPLYSTQMAGHKGVIKN